jgi:hypothetical protein
VIGNAEQRILQIDHVAEHGDRDDLASAASHDLVAHAEARAQQPAMGDQIPVVDQPRCLPIVTTS